MKQPFRLTPDGLLLSLRVTPNAGVDRIEGFEPRDDGTMVLRLRVKAVPDKGKANAAVIALLAKALGSPNPPSPLVSGDTARLKIVRIVGDSAQLAQKLVALAGSSP